MRRAAPPLMRTIIRPAGAAALLLTAAMVSQVIKDELF
jgi:hypothetical protein